MTALATLLRRSNALYALHYLLQYGLLQYRNRMNLKGFFKPQYSFCSSLDYKPAAALNAAALSVGNWLRPLRLTSLRELAYAETLR